MRPLLLLSATCLANILLAACESKPEPAAESGAHVYYNCDEQRGFGAAFNAESCGVELEIDGRRVTLPQIPSASGAAYSDCVVSQSSP